ncbi:MAG: MTH938/NDUFAF3 family protein [Calditrichia bacterium]
MEKNGRIKDYGFGRMTIDGQTYQSDVIIYPDRVDVSWWRKEGHLLLPEDLPMLETNSPKILVVGQGKFGLMKISAAFIQSLKRLEIDLRAAKSDEAVKIYNSIWETGERNVIGAFHLTC